MLVAIVRHAKAERESGTGRDIDRGLTGRGERQAAFLAARFAAHSVRPDGLVSSRATRTRETAAPIAAACGVDFDFDDRLLVDMPVSGAIEVIEEHAGSKFLVLVGHNEQVSDLAMTLTRGLGRGSSGDSGQWDDVLHLSTGQAVVLEVVNKRLIGGCRVVDVWRLDGD